MSLTRTIGSGTIDGLAYLGGLARLSWAAVRAAAADLFGGKKFTFTRAVHQAMAVGVGALPILSLITFFVGTILALQSAYELRKLGAIQYVASAVAISMSRELGPLMTAIVVIGKIGRASCRERVEMAVVAVALNNKRIM